MNVLQWGAVKLNNTACFRGCANLTAMTPSDALVLLTANLLNLFLDCVNLTGITNIGAWDVSNVTSLAATFSNTKFNADLSTWNVGKVNNMSDTFSGNTVFNQPLSTWDTSKVQTMSSMFGGCTAFNRPLNSWNTSSCASMSSMFGGAVAFNQPLDLWDTSKVTNMSNMFNTAWAFNQSLGTWSVVSLTNAALMFSGAVAWNNVQTHPAANYRLLLLGWSAQVVKPSVVFGAGTVHYGSGDAAAARAVLTGAPNSWVITDGGA